MGSLLFLFFSDHVFVFDSTILRFFEGLLFIFSRRLR